MPNLILYSTKHGTAHKYALSLAKHLKSQTDILNIQTKEIIDLAPYDSVIIIASIYAGKVKDQVRHFCRSQLAQLRTKKLCLAICCWMEGPQAEKQLFDAFPPELLEHAVAKVALGGEINFDRMNFLERLAMKLIAKQKQNVSHFDEEAIKKLGSALNELDNKIT